MKPLVGKVCILVYMEGTIIVVSILKNYSIQKFRYSVVINVVTVLSLTSVVVIKVVSVLSLTSQ